MTLLKKKKKNIYEYIFDFIISQSELLISSLKPDSQGRPQDAAEVLLSTSRHPSTQLWTSEFDLSGFNQSPADSD